MQNALRHEAKLLYCAFDLMFHDGEDLRGLTLLERKKRLKEILPGHNLIAFSRHRKTSGTKFFEEAERKGLEGIMAKRADSRYVSGRRTDNWLKMKTSKRQEVVIAGFTAPRRTRPFFERWPSRCARRTAGGISVTSARGSATKRLKRCTPS
jgi:bifunctional non-homologous end joining protein LigD